VHLKIETIGKKIIKKSKKSSKINLKYATCRKLHAVTLIIGAKSPLSHKTSA